MTTNNITARLNELRRSHYICEDCWYSCPESGECCDHDSKGCQCGATKHNEKLDALIAELANTNC